MSFFKSIRENLKDPRKKSLTLLAIYAVFFIFVFLVLNTKDSSSNNIVNNDKKVNNYNFKVTYKLDNLIEQIDGSYYKDVILFKYNNELYFYKNNNVYKIKDNYYYNSQLKYDLNKIQINELYTLKDKLTEEYKTTYKDNTIEINYSIDSNTLYNYLYNKESNLSNTSYIKVTKKDDKIKSLTIDLNSLNIFIKQIEVEYTDIDSISEIDLSNYTYRE